MEREEGAARRIAWRARVSVGFAWGLALLLRLVCVLLGAPSSLGRRVEISTPVNSISRLAEGYWLRHTGNSPYAGSAYHGSPLLLALYGPLTTSRIGGEATWKSNFSLVCIVSDLMAALLLAEIGRRVQSSQSKHFLVLNVTKLMAIADGAKLGVGDLAAMCYLWNPFTLFSCVGGCTSSIENALLILSLYGAVAGNVPLAAFGWVMATHFSMYPAILLIPITLSLTVGIDHPPTKVFRHVRMDSLNESERDLLPAAEKNHGAQQIDKGLFKESSYTFSFKVTKLRDLLLWSALCWAYVLILCKIALGKSTGLEEMFSETYGFILKVEDLSPNLGLFWYFFTEVFDFFRPFFLLVFHSNIVFMIIPLTIRLHHRPLFLAFVFCLIFAMLKSYPSVGDTALYLGLMPLFINELSGMRFTFFLLNGYIGVALLSPVMYNLWIWRGTGNANFYFAMALSYACIQMILMVESISTLLIFDRNLRKLQDTSGKVVVEETKG